MTDRQYCLTIRGQSPLQFATRFGHVRYSGDGKPDVFTLILSEEEAADLKSDLEALEGTLTWTLHSPMDEEVAEERKRWVRFMQGDNLLGNDSD